MVAVKQAVGELRILFKTKYQLPITDPRFKDATDEEIVLDYVLSLAGRDMTTIPEDLEEDEIEWLAQVENGEIDMEDFLEKETEKYFPGDMLKELFKDDDTTD